jgi:hypothetical protein
MRCDVCGVSPSDQNCVMAFGFWLLSPCCSGTSRLPSGLLFLHESTSRTKSLYPSIIGPSATYSYLSTATSTRIFTSTFIVKFFHVTLHIYSNIYIINNTFPYASPSRIKSPISFTSTSLSYPYLHPLGYTRCTSTSISAATTTYCHICTSTAIISFTVIFTSLGHLHQRPSLPPHPLSIHWYIHRHMTATPASTSTATSI